MELGLEHHLERTKYALVLIAKVSSYEDFSSTDDISGYQEEFINNILNYVAKNGDMEKVVLRDNRVFFESLVRLFPDKAPQVAGFISRLHDAITAA